MAAALQGMLRPFEAQAISAVGVQQIGARDWVTPPAASAVAASAPPTSITLQQPGPPALPPYPRLLHCLGQRERGAVMLSVRVSFSIASLRAARQECDDLMGWSAPRCHMQQAQWHHQLKAVSGSTAAAASMALGGGL